ncbi:polyprotein [Endive necrotic mosaic virus]|uniref:Genome polyprotein n=1 Tax=Endive necrotic mosaic virus TaxID=73423 RepID=A0A1W5T6Y6_9POTV|nr:polyprotein [Endive necrotic mosaic virus]ARF07717.1 polyprotein [Endive necrotic mosaic virus]
MASIMFGTINYTQFKAQIQTAQQRPETNQGKDMENKHKESSCVCGMKLRRGKIEIPPGVEKLDFSDKLKNRDACLFSKSGKPYAYTGGVHDSKGWHPICDEILKSIGVPNGTFNQCLVQRYQPGGKIGLHADNEKCYAQGHQVLTVNATGEGRFTVACRLGSMTAHMKQGDWLLMPHGCQETHKHKVVADAERISFTFRKEIDGSTPKCAHVAPHNKQPNEVDNMSAVQEMAQRRADKYINCSLTQTAAGRIRFEHTKPVVAGCKTMKQAIRDGWVPERIITKIEISNEKITSSIEPIIPRVPHATSKSLKKCQKQRQIRKSETAIANLVKLVGAIAKTNNKRIQVIGKRTNNLEFRTRRGIKELFTLTKHESGKFARRDVKADDAYEWLVGLILSSSKTKRKLLGSEITHGDSGLTIPTSRLVGTGQTDRVNLCVRGALNGQLLDARETHRDSNIMQMTHYSDVAVKFWKGFNKQFLEQRGSAPKHNCESNFDVERCGSVAAIICQAIFPSHRITCNACAREFEQLTEKERYELLHPRVNRTLDLLNREYREFTHVTQTLKDVVANAQGKTGDYDIFAETQALISHRKEAPFSHVNRINETLTRGSGISANDIVYIQRELLEIARYLNNRTENIKQGSLASFRNKVSAKAHINPALMCDNQLDKNGNFVWGERGKHAKRFLTNFYTKIDPTRGYDNFLVRKNPNGSRKLAIGNLILSTNFESLRDQMEGEPIEEQNLTNACVSKLEGTFEYPCCCVTREDGTPLKSGLIMPTKNHLVVGNTGDPKYVDLPTEIETGLYVAAEGYCYVNIFMAMLVNVDEVDAKDFTKMTRDTIIPRLDKWPSMMDVATACYFLATFYPGVLNAELPRILIDHKTKTMHELDSYGSRETGFHILKANTVKQLLRFAMRALDSEMKNYLVGGTVAQSEYASMKLLIRGVYRPHILINTLESEPHMLTLSLLSPSVLIAMHNSGSFEQAVQMFVKKDMNVATLFVTLSTLAQRCSVARCIVEQQKIIEGRIDDLIELVNASRMKTPISQLAMTMLIRIANRRDTDAQLVANGYELLANKSMEILEKNYKQELEASWRALPLCGKFSAIKRSLKGFVYTAKSEIRIETGDSTGNSHISRRQLLGKVSKKIAKCAKSYNTRINSLVHACGRQIRSRVFSAVNYMVPDIIRFINILVVFSLFVSIITTLHGYILKHREMQMAIEAGMDEKNERLVYGIYKQMCDRLGHAPTKDEFLSEVGAFDSNLGEWANKWVRSQFIVKLQARSQGQTELERVVAFVALVMMLFDCERSDCVYKVLNKLKGCIGTIEGGVKHQSLDDIQTEAEEKLRTTDFVLDMDRQPPSTITDTTFQEWWEDSLARNSVIPHYRSEGVFKEFTRATATQVANEIAHSEHTDFLIRGAVGSGKSTGLPFQLQMKGHVLLLEPTRPLAINVANQLRETPFFLKPTMRIRGASHFGSSPVTVMTSGFALQYLGHNPSQLRDFKFIIFDECHVHDSAAMAFRALLAEHQFQGKIIKTSATPPGREVEFTTQHPVDIITEDNLSYEQFARGQGSGVNYDVTHRGDNILVYVPSYNAVDSLARDLLAKNFMVTKVDGRTMKMGNLSIQTHGTPSKKHFIVATNIIENGVTLDIDVVVDFGLKVVAYLDVEDRTIRYKQVCISYGERIQRLGRVGRFKKGTALRIGSTEKGLQEIPQMVATEAALFCFCFSLPVMAANVSLSLLANCTLRQVRTMMKFEVTPYYMAQVTSHDGSMHPSVHATLKKYILKDSEILLNKMALPYTASRTWITAGQYERLGCKNDMPESVRIPFWCKEVPAKTHEDVWDCILKNKSDVTIKPISSHSACKVAYTLKTDPASIMRTIATIDQLIVEEQTQLAYFAAATESTITSSRISLHTIISAMRTRYASNHTLENIAILQKAKAQILEFKNLNSYEDMQEENEAKLINKIMNCGATGLVQHQGINEISKALGLKGKWNASLITRDVIVLGGVALGGAYMIYTWFKQKFNEPVTHQGKGKRHLQKLRFREARDKKVGYFVHADDDTIGAYFGEAYTKRGKVKGSTQTKGMGMKNRKFVNFYGYDPADYSLVRFVDPLTGHIIEDSPHVDVSLIQEEFTAERLKELEKDEDFMEQMTNHNTIQAYFIKNMSTDALRVDLTPHKPLAAGNKSTSIAGSPEREGELRQTGPPVIVPISTVPEIENGDVVGHEARSLQKGLRDYNPIASMICKLTNIGGDTSLYGIGYGPYIITNRHLFRKNNGELRIESRHGEFLVKNTCTLKMHPVEGRDIVIIQLPKDFPPFPSKLRFRQPMNGESICMVGSNFQTKSITSTVSESSTTYQLDGSNFWKHWISTSDGQCGLPLVALSDGHILGIHSLASCVNTVNYFASIPLNFEAEKLNTKEALKWTQHWVYNPKEVCWGGLGLKQNQPVEPFKVSKLISDLFDDAVKEQACTAQWVMNELYGNLKAVAACPSQLVTKHTVQGKCRLFEIYLNTHNEERDYFKPLMGAYDKSKLNRAAFLKDVLKYAKPTIVGEVNHKIFQQACKSLLITLREVGMVDCKYITDHMEIIDSLNMKSAVGAQYSGKKRQYFEDYTDSDYEELVRASCKRLYMGQFGLWNGSPKAELRPIEKTLANKTRVFTAAPLDTLLGGKVCVDDFNNQFYSHNLEAPWSVGMTKFHKGWDKLLKSLPDGWVYCDADGSQFDSSLTPYLINAVLDTRLEFMEDWDVGRQMIRNLYTEIIYTPILAPDGSIIKKCKGNNSGQPSTVVDNTLMVILAMKYALIQAKIPSEEHDLYCKYFANGDDLLIAIHPNKEHILDTFAESFAQLGLNYTFDTRTQNREDLWFMSHKGVLIDDTYIPKLEKERIVSILEWDRSHEPVHRLEAICASMIEAWGYPELLYEIRKFYAWVLEQAPYSELAKQGKAPYIAEIALRNLYLSTESTPDEIGAYIRACWENYNDDHELAVTHQGDKLDAGQSSVPQPKKDKNKEQGNDLVSQPQQDKDVNVGTSGTFPVPRVKSITNKMRLPKSKGQVVLNLEHLLEYKPDQLDLSNTRSTHVQFDGWYNGVKEAYDVTDDQMKIILNGLVVWCIENGTSPNINGSWVMMDGEEQVTYALKPILENAKPTFRQIMAHFSNVAEAYIEMRNLQKPYMPRYGRQRNLNDMNLARFAFDFYEVTSNTPPRAREAHMQMKAAALSGVQSKLFGLDGGVSTTSEDTERHTANDVSKNMHSLLGMTQH